MKTKAAKQVQVVARYAHKTGGNLNGIVTYLVRASDGESTYSTTLVQGKASGCSCKSRNGRCYHRTQLTVLEASRQVVETIAQEVVEVAPVVERATTYSKDRACRVYVDTQEPVEGQVVNGLVWDAERGWIAPQAEKQTYRIISIGTKKERRDLVSELQAKREHKETLLAEAREIKARKASRDLGLAGHLNRKAFAII